MKDEDLDRILAAEENILPSSGFARAVMQAVHREATAPPPIPFPWKRAIPGIAASAAVFVSMLFTFGYLFHTSGDSPDSVMTLSWLKEMIEPATHFGLGWLALAFLLSLASLSLSMRLSASRV